MKRAFFRFYGPLNDFLPIGSRGMPIACTFTVGGAVKDFMEAKGVPHTEVALVLVNGELALLSRQVADGDRISVYPTFVSIDVSGLISVHARPPIPPRFVLDTHLGRLAAYLRMLGFDTLYRNDYSDEELARISSAEQRILLTRDTGPLKRSMVTLGYYVRQQCPRQQVVEVLQRFDLAEYIAPFQRCLDCNQLLEPVAKVKVRELLRANTERFYDQFWRCPGCERVYWKGSHYDRMRQFIATLKPEAA